MLPPLILLTHTALFITDLTRNLTIASTRQRGASTLRAPRRAKRHSGCANPIIGKLSSLRMNVAPLLQRFVRALLSQLSRGRDPAQFEQWQVSVHTPRGRFQTSGSRVLLRRVVRETALWRCSISLTMTRVSSSFTAFRVFPSSGSNRRRRP